ncbi:MAG: TIGR01620 family protein [Pseudomonadota bacterium]
MSEPRKGPIVLDLDGEAAVSPAEAPPVPETGAGAEGRAMAAVGALATGRRSRLARWFWGVLVALLTLFLSVAAYDFVVSMLARHPALAAAAMVLLGLFLAISIVVVIREWAALARLQRIDRLHREAAGALAGADISAARRVTAALLRLYRGRADMRWPLERFEERAPELLDADALFGLAETELLMPLDRAAQREVEAAARQVATITALVPLALADVIGALAANLRMIRRIAEIYGGRGGALGSWRLIRSVFAHLIATGAVAVGDDMLGSVAGGGLLGKLSRRFGEGLINGALTARVGIAAMETCRPLPFETVSRPSVSALVRRALTGLFDRAEAAGP